MPDRGQISNVRGLCARVVSVTPALESCRTIEKQDGMDRQSLPAKLERSPRNSVLSDLLLHAQATSTSEVSVAKQDRSGVATCVWRQKFDKHARTWKPEASLQ